MSTTQGGGVVASVVDPFDDANLDDPYAMYHELREAGEVVYLERYDVYAMARFDDVRTALRDHETYCSSRGVGLSDFATEKPWRAPSLILEADPPDHAGARKAVTGVLSRSAINALRTQFTACATTLVERALERRDIDGVHDLAHEFPLTVFPRAMGIPDWGRESLLPYGAMVFNGFGPQNHLFEDAMAAGTAVRENIMAMTRIENLDPDGFAYKINLAAGEAGYDEDERSLIVRSVLSAGVDTTVHGLGNALYCFAENPDQWQALRADPSLTDPAFDETVRFESPVQTFFRTTTRDVEVADTVIPDGSKVLLFYASANRDPRRWEHPDRFDIARRVTGHLGYGNGIHACVGRTLARLEADCLLRVMADRVARIECTGEPVRQRSNALRGLDSLPLRIHPA
jgi:cytochrome P450